MHDALASLPGVRQVQVDYGRKQATVTVAGKQTNSSTLLAELQREGYGGSVVAER